MRNHSLLVKCFQFSLFSMIFIVGCDEGHLVSYSHGTDGKMIKTDYSYVYRETKMSADGKVGIDFIVDQGEGKGYLPGTRELGLLPPSDVYAYADVNIHLVNLTNEPIDLEILSYKQPYGELVEKTMKVTVLAEAAHRINFGVFRTFKYHTKIEGFKVKYKCFGKNYTESFSPKRLSLQEWDEYYYAPDRIKADSAAELFQKTHKGN
jgi:hypothetical protein